MHNSDPMGYSKGGVYQIINLVNGKVYIGSTGNFKKRWSRHVSSLRGGIHKNAHLQASWNKHGEDSFEFQPIEAVKGNKLKRTMREQSHIDRWKSKWEKCYNFKRKVVYSSGPWSKSPENTRKKKRLNQKRLWADPKYRTMMLGRRKPRKHSEESRKKISQAKLGHLVDEQTRKKISQSLKSRGCKTYCFRSPDGEVVTVANLRGFCEMNSLKYDSMRHVWHGRRNSCKGWTAIRSGK